MRKLKPSQYICELQHPEMFEMTWASDRWGLIMGLPAEIAREVGHAHYAHGCSREFLADCLEAIGY